MKKFIITLVVIAAVSLAGFGVFKYISAKKASQKSTVQYATAKASLRDIQKVISASGSVDTSETDKLTAAGRDQINEVSVKENQSVKKGDTLITFENGSTSITAPYDGIISSVLVKSGDKVSANQELIDMFDSKNLITKINVDETDLPNVKIGQNVNIKVNAYPDVQFTGKVTDIKQEGDYSNGVSTFEVTIAFDKINDIKVGMTTDATIVVSSKTGVLTVPIEAVREMNGNKVVMVPGENNTRSVKQVTTGIASDTYVEITSGISEGDTVLLPQTTTSAQSSNRTGMFMNGGSFGLGGGRMTGGSGRSNTSSSQNRTGGSSKN